MKNSCTCIYCNLANFDAVASVLVVERGQLDDGPHANVPYFANINNVKDMELIESAKISKLNNSRANVIVANVVGGGSVVNGMVYDRGSKADYDAWEELGNVGWSFNGLLPYFKKGTTFTPPSQEVTKEFNITWDTEAYGHGPLQITIANFQYPDLGTVWNAWKSEGVPLPRGPDNGEAVGAFWTPHTADVHDGRRSSARKAYYDPASSRSNLKLLTGHVAQEIIFDGNTAKGVRILSLANNQTTAVYARKETILAAGAIRTPHLLQVSGVGPKALLQSANISVKIDLASVGANFQDHPYASAVSNNVSNISFPNPNSINVNATFNASVWNEYTTNHTGLIAASRGNSLAFLSLSQVTAEYQTIINEAKAQDKPAAYLPAIYSSTPSLMKGFIAQRAILLRHYASDKAAVAEFPIAPGGGALVAVQKQLSRGTITINPTEPHGPPIVQYNTFQNPIDADILVAGVQRARKLWQNPVLQKFNPVEVFPGPQVKNKQQIMEALVGGGLIKPSFAHPSGSCAMMPQELGGCVSDKLLVYGAEKLSIVDASIIPLIPSCHLQATMYGIAEKAADIIKSRG